MTGDVDTPVSAQPPRIADVEPFLRDALRDSWQALKRDPSLLILASALASVVSALSLGLLSGPMTVGLILIVHRRLHGQSARIRDVFDGLSSAASSLVASVLIALAAAFGFVLAVLPGLLVLAAACFAFHEVCYRRVTAIDAIKGSLQLLKAHLLHVLLLLTVVGFLNALACIWLFALLVTLPFSVVLMTVAYERLSRQTTGSQIATLTV